MIKKLILLITFFVTIEANSVSKNDFELIRYSYIGDMKKVSSYIKYNNSTALLYAGYKNHIEIAKLLIKNGANINAKSISKKDILYYGVQNNNIEFVKYLLDIGTQHSKIDDYYTLKDYDTHHKAIKTTLLITAIQNGHLDIAKLLIKNGANINKVNSKNETPILTAMRNRHFSMARYLINHGADLSVQDIAGNNILTYAITLNQENIALKAILYVDINQWVNSSIFEGKPYVYEHYIYKKDGSIKFVNYLHLASRYGQLRVMKILLDKGQNIELLSKDENYPFSALEYAIYFSDVSTVKFLVKNGANPYKKYIKILPWGKYRTLLSYAMITPNTIKNRQQIIQYLMTLENSSWYKKNETNDFYKKLSEFRNKTDQNTTEVTLDEKLPKAISKKDIREILYLTRGDDERLLGIVKKLSTCTNLNEYNFLYLYFNDRETNVDKKIVKEFTKLQLKFKNLQEIYLLYSDNAVAFILHNKIFKENILSLHQHSDITNIAISVYQNKRRSNYRIEMMFEFVYRHKLNFDFKRFQKEIKKDDTYMQKLIKIYDINKGK